MTFCAFVVIVIMSRTSTTRVYFFIAVQLILKIIEKGKLRAILKESYL